MSNYYNTTRRLNEFEFINNEGDRYLVYIGEYFLEHERATDENDLIKVNHIGFSCRRLAIKKRYLFDHKSQATIKAIFLTLINERPNDAFVYLCDNSDKRARNRRITFGRWIKESDQEHQFSTYNMHIKVAQFDATLILRDNNPLHHRYKSAFEFTIHKYYT